MHAVSQSYSYYILAAMWTAVKTKLPAEEFEVWLEARENPKRSVICPEIIPL